MSLTSVELNYLVWRYLQDSGLELAAYALEKGTQCLLYEQKKDFIISKIEPCSLVNLVQKGILFTLIESNAEGNAGQDSNSLIEALIKEVSNRENINEDQFVRFGQSKSGSNDTIEKGEAEVQKGVTDGEQEDSEQTGKTEAQNAVSTAALLKELDFPESLCNDWHMSTDVFAYGKLSSCAVINALKDGNIAESVSLNHTNVFHEKPGVTENEITIVSWAPTGNTLVTSSLSGELRAWTPDGKLKNIAYLSLNPTADPATELLKDGESSQIPPLIYKLIWNNGGQFFISLDTDGQLTLWDGNSLSIIYQSKAKLPSVDVKTIDACWIDSHKFAASTSNDGIKIYGILSGQGAMRSYSAISADTDTPQVKQIGSLVGHSNTITILRFGTLNNQLASCSDVDYLIKIWQSNSTHEYVQLNNRESEKYQPINYHNSPIIDLYWLRTSDDGEMLLSISMEGNINLWDSLGGDNVFSTNIFETARLLPHTDLSDSYHATKNALVFSAVLSPDQKWLAVGDNFGRVTVWDVDLRRYVKGEKFRLQGSAYFFPLSKDAINDPKTLSLFGICDISWNNASSRIAISYKGRDSIILKFR